jgi:predicted flap endonuclease-1-like 5' DNA nuclease
VANTSPHSIRWTGGLSTVGLVIVFSAGCATAKDLDTLGVQVNDQVAALARERIKQLEQVIETLQKSGPVDKAKEAPSAQKL